MSIPAPYGPDRNPWTSSLRAERDKPLTVSRYFFNEGNKSTYLAIRVSAQRHLQVFQVLTEVTC